MPAIPEVKAGQWLGRFPDDDTKVLSYGYRFYPPGRGNGAFCSTYGRSSVYVYAHVECWPSGSPAPMVTTILAETSVGTARLVREADKIGRKGVRDLVRPALAAFFSSTSSKC